MEITGKIVQILPAQTGKSAKGEWKKQEFILETLDQFPKKICITNWNDKLNINEVDKNTPVVISIDIESREYNGRWYTDVKAWKMEVKTKTPTTSKTNDYSSEIPPAEISFDSDELGPEGDLPF